MSNLDTRTADDSMTSARLARTDANSMKAAVLFVPCVLIAAHLGVSNPLTQWGAMVFAAARIGYAILDPLGVIGRRTLAWNAGFLATGALALGLLTA